MRIVLGLLFLAAGLAKALHPDLFAAQVAAYQLVPSRLVTLVALVLPRVEILAGLGLVAKVLPRSCALVTGLLALAFAVGTSLALMRGLAIDCGCLPVSVQISWFHPLLDLGLLALSLAVSRKAGRSSEIKP